MSGLVQSEIAGLTEDERSDAADLARDLPALRRHLQELDVLLQQNELELESQRVRSASATEALRQLEQGGFSREQYQQVVTQAHQSQLRHLSVQHQQELLQSKRETMQQLVDVAHFALLLATRLDPSVSDAPVPAPTARPAEPEPVPTSAAEALPPPSESAIIEAQEEERGWIARQLHNGPAQALTNLILRAEICERLVTTDTEAVKGELHELRETIHRTLQDMRRFIFDVRPMILDDLGLLPALRRFVDDWNDQQGHTPVTLSVIGPDRRFARAKELAVFRIVQDAVKIPEGRSGDRATATQVVLEERTVRVTLETPTASRLENAPAGDSPLPAGYHTIQQRAAIVGGTTSLEQRPGVRSMRIVIPLE